MMCFYERRIDNVDKIECDHILDFRFNISLRTICCTHLFVSVFLV